MKGSRTLAVTLLFSILPAGMGLWACGDDTVVALPDSGGGTDATLDVPVEAEQEEAAEEASCAVDAGPLDDAQIALGQTIISTHRCFLCHGQTLSGNNDGVQWAADEGGMAYPPNLTSDPTTGLGCWTNDQIENAILNGIDNEGMPLCPPMPQFGHLDDGGLDPTEVQAVIEYLRSLPVIVNQVPNTNCTFSDAGPEGGPGEGGTDSGPDATTSDAGDAGTDAPVEAAPMEAGGDAADAAGDAQEAGGD